MHTSRYLMPKAVAVAELKRVSLKKSGESSRGILLIADAPSNEFKNIKQLPDLAPKRRLVPAQAFKRTIVEIGQAEKAASNLGIVRGT